VHLFALYSLDPGWSGERGRAASTGHVPDTGGVPDSGGAGLAGAHDVLRVRLEGPRCPDDGVDAPRTMLLPFARAFAPVVDRHARRMEVAPPPGLLEAALEPRLPKKEKKGQRRPRLRPSRQGDEERGGAAGGEGAGARGGEGRGARRREDGGARGAEAERARP